MEKNYMYKAYGLFIESEFEMPELLKAEGSADVVIRYGSVPDELEECAEKGVLFQASKDRFILNMKNIAKYYVIKGKEIIIEPALENKEEEIRLFLLGSVIGALLHQRGYLVLHGSCVNVNGKGVIFTGKSGVGKSTIASAFGEKGHTLLTDDVIAVEIKDDGTPYVIPGFPSIKLWYDAVKRAGKNPDSLIQIRKEMQKYRVGIEENFCIEPVEVSKIYILSFHNQEEISISKIESLKKIEAVIDNTYRFRFLKGQGGKAAHFKQCAAVAAKAELYNMARPSSRFTLQEIIKEVEKEMGV